MRSLEFVRPIVVEQNAKRKHWDNQDFDFVSNYFREEFGELEQALWQEESNFNRWEIASELGDVGYLMMRLEEQAHKEGKSIPSDLLFFYHLAHNVSTLLNINFAEAIFMKAVRNDLKYPFSVTNAFDSFEEATNVSRQMWTQMGGDKAFYKWYESSFGTI